jgi:hypothetical protein
MNIEQIRLRCRNGAAFLDWKRPGWFHKVDPETLDMRDTMGNCLASQVEGLRYWGAVESLGITTDQAEQFGFVCSIEHAMAGTDEYPDLLHEWRLIICERLTAESHALTAA